MDGSVEKLSIEIAEAARPGITPSTKRFCWLRGV